MLGYGLIGYLQKDGSVVFTSESSLGWIINKFNTKEQFNDLIKSVRSWHDDPVTYKKIKGNFKEKPLRNLLYPKEVKKLRDILNELEIPDFNGEL